MMVYPRYLGPEGLHMHMSVATPRLGTILVLGLGSTTAPPGVLEEWPRLTGGDPQGLKIGCLPRSFMNITNYPCGEL